MRRFLAFVLVLVLWFGSVTVTVNTEAVSGRELTFDTQGRLVSLEEGERELKLEGLLIDVGWNEGFILQQAGYSDLELLHTWDLPVLAVRHKDIPTELELISIREEGSQTVVVQAMGDLEWSTTYENGEHALAVKTKITNSGEATGHVNGVNFVLRGMEVPGDAAFEFPGSLPYGQFRNDRAFTVISTDYASPLTHITSEEGNLEVIFANEAEKWRTGAFFDWNGGLGIHHLSATQALLEPGESIEVGTLFLQFSDDEQGLQPLRDLYNSLGWFAPQDGVEPGPVYSGHPYGTMDTDFTHPGTLQDYAEELPRIKAMGYEAIWLLPIFTHPGNWVYAPPDQTEIDPRYGGREEARVFIDKAHELDMSVLFDLVPHGPDPAEPIVQENPEWPSLKLDGDYQIEWDCVSFDYNHPGYMAYTRDFIEDYALNLGLDGARIDCAMGGLSNWSPQEGFRPSESGLRAGLTITQTVRQGILDGGRTPLILPENFHPVPFYAPYTDLFYDMTLYRVLFELRTRGVDGKTLARTLTHWLDMQQAAKPEGLVHLRFLSNHDTADWTWDAARPIKIHGVDRAKAYWVLFSLIDGVPMLHAGDEDASLYNHGTTDLTEFFAEVNFIKKMYTDNLDPTIYDKRSDAIVHFERGDLDVYINLGHSSEPMGRPEGDLIFEGGVSEQGSRIILESSGYAVFAN